MLTQFQTIEPQAALLAACSRPRALAVSAVVPASASRAQGAAWSRATAPIAALVRRPDSVVERPQAGYGAERVLPGTERVELGGNGTTGITMAGNGLQHPQDKQHLTTRREPVTWRPPH